MTTDSGNTEFADMRDPCPRCRDQVEIEDLVCEHSLVYSRGQLGSPIPADERGR